MARTLELAFALAGKLQASFIAATQAATSQLTGVFKATEKISAAAQKRYDAKMLKNLSAAAGDARKAVGRLGGEISGTFLTVATPLAAAGAGLYNIATKSAGYADQAVKNAQSVGMSTAAFTEMAYAAKMADVSQQDFVSGTAKLSKAVESALGGNKKMIDSFASAGIGAEDLVASLEQPEKLYAKLADAFAAMPDGMIKSNLAMDFFGKSGKKLIPLLNGGAASIEQLREDARRLGISLSETDGKNAEAFNDSFANIGESMCGVSLIIGKNLWPNLTKVHEAISAWITANGQLLAQNLPGWIDEAKKHWPALKAELLAAWEGVKGVTQSIHGLVQSMGGWIPVIKRVVQAWLVYRGIRIIAAIGGVVKSVINLKSAFVDALPAMVRWVAGKRKMAQSLVGFAQATVHSIAEFARAAGRTAVRGLASFADAAWTGIKADAQLLCSLGRTIAQGFTRFAAGAWRATAAVGKFAISLAAQGVSALTSFAASVGTGIISALAGLGAGLTAAATAAWSFAAALFANPITWIVAGVVALGAAAVWLYKNWDQVCASLAAAWGWMKDAAAAAFDGIAAAAGDINIKSGGRVFVTGRGAAPNVSLNDPAAPANLAE